MCHSIDRKPKRQRVGFGTRLVFVAFLLAGGYLQGVFAQTGSAVDSAQQVVNAISGARLDALNERVHTLETTNPAAVANELTHVKSDLKDLQDSVTEQRKWLYGIFAAVIGHMLITSPIRLGTRKASEQSDDE